MIEPFFRKCSECSLLVPKESTRAVDDRTLCNTCDELARTIEPTQVVGYRVSWQSTITGYSGHGSPLPSASLAVTAEPS